MTRMTNWRKHENQATKSTYYKGKIIRCQQQSKSTRKRPDIVAYSKHGSERIIGEAKWCTKAKKKHVDQALRYKSHPFYAQKAIIHYPQNAEVPDAVRDYARKKNVIITKTHVPKVKKPSGLLGWFIEPKYQR